MATRILTQAEVRRLLPMSVCIDLMADALATLARPGSNNPLRRGIRVPDTPRLLGLMPGYLAEPEALGLKAVAVFPENHGGTWDSHQGVVVLFETEHGRPIAIQDASEITAIRTAAVSAVATRLLAREDAGDLALIGSGVQARTHLEAMAQVRELRRVRVYSPTKAHREAFAAREGERHGLAVESVASARAAVEGADIVCTTTSAREPVLEGAWLAPGAHVNAVGSSIPAARELDSEAVVRSRVFVDRRESTLRESGDFLVPLREGRVGEEHLLAELGEVLTDAHGGRATPDEVTLFLSLGLAVEDLAAAHYVHARAEAEGVGVTVELGGRAHDES